MAIRVQRHANVSKQATLLDGLDVSPLKWRVCGCGLHQLVHEGMNHISNVKVHLKTGSRNVNIRYIKIVCTFFYKSAIEQLLASSLVYIDCLNIFLQKCQRAVVSKFIGLY